MIIRNTLAAAMTAAGRSPGELEYVGGIRGTFAGPGGPADLKDIRDRVIAELAGLPEPGVPIPDQPSILCAEALGSSIT